MGPRAAHPAIGTQLSLQFQMHLNKVPERTRTTLNAPRCRRISQHGKLSRATPPDMLTHFHPESLGFDHARSEEELASGSLAVKPVRSTNAMTSTQAFAQAFAYAFAQVTADIYMGNQDARMQFRPQPHVP